MPTSCRKAIAYLKSCVLGEDAHEISLSQSDSPVLFKLNDELLVAYLVDTGATSTLTYIQYRHLDEDSITPEQLHEYGLANLKSLADQKLRVQEYGPIFAVFLDGTFEASLLLVDELWDKALAHLVDYRFMAAIPTRDVLAFGDSSSSAAREELVKVISRTAGGKHSLSGSLYRRIESRWITDDLDTGRPS